MNLKAAKEIRKAMRSMGVNPKETAYSAPLPYISAWFETIKHPITGKEGQVRQTAKPLTLDRSCGRAKYQMIKGKYLASRQAG